MDQALEGCKGCFIGLEFNGDPELFVQQGKIAVDAAKAQKIEHFIWRYNLLISTMDGNVCIPEFDAKAHVDRYLKSSGVPRTSVYTSIPYESLQTCIHPHNDFVSLDIPVEKDAELAVYSVNDTGGWVAEIFEHPKVYIGDF